MKATASLYPIFANTTDEASFIPVTMPKRSGEVRKKNKSGEKGVFIFQRAAFKIHEDRYLSMKAAVHESSGSSS